MNHIVHPLLIRELKAKLALFILLISVLGMMFANPFRPKPIALPINQPVKFDLSNLGDYLLFCNIEQNRTGQPLDQTD